MRARKKIKFSIICILTLTTLLLITGAYKTIGQTVIRFLPLFMENPIEDITDQRTDTESVNPLPPITLEPIRSNTSNEDLFSPNVILVSLKDQKVVYEDSSEERIYPASLTKIMTAIVAIENISNLQESVFLPEGMFQDLYSANASMAGFLPGEEVAAIDLLYGTILPSGAEASMGLALWISGSESKFVKLMNEKAKELGMNDTHFENVSGLHDDKHYTTVKDMAKLLKVALKNETFREIFTTDRHFVDSTNLHPNGITFYSTLFEDMETCEFDGGRFLGGKTGYTEEAGLCLASLAEKNGIEYILITAGAPGNHKSKQYHIMDAFTVYGEYLKQ